MEFLPQNLKKIDTLPSTVVFIMVLNVLDYKIKSASYSSVKHLLKTKSKINKKFRKKNKQNNILECIICF